MPLVDPVINAALPSSGRGVRLAYVGICVMTAPSTAVLCPLQDADLGLCRPMPPVD
jgi:hypothetical protein